MIVGGGGGRPEGKSDHLGGGGLVASMLVACGGDGGNRSTTRRRCRTPSRTSGQKLSFVYFQKCVQPVFLKQLQINQNGVISTNTCAAAGCHDNATGTGGAFRLLGNAQPVDMANPANTPDVIRTTDMYKNFYSVAGRGGVRGAAVEPAADQAADAQCTARGRAHLPERSDPNVMLIRYWISRPMPQGQDEFSSAANSMFTPADPNAGICNTQ